MGRGEAAFGVADRYRYSLTRDTAGRITSRIETIGGETILRTYAYDLLGRLVEVHRNGELAEAYAYDADGNRTETRVPSRGIESHRVLWRL